MQHDPRCGAILCAAEEELAPFLPHLAEEQRLSRAMLTLHIGRICGMRMVLTATGMCKVNAALAVQTVLDTVSPDFVLNAGTAGGMSPPSACSTQPSPQNAPITTWERIF